MQEGSENDWGESCKNADDLVRQYTWLGTNGIETVAMTLDHTIDAKPVPTFIRPDAVPDYQFYRASYTNVLIERCRQADIPCVSIPTLTDDDLEGWLITLRVFYLPGLMHDDPAESQLIQNRGGGRGRSLDATLARRAMLKRAILSAQQPFEEGWTAEETAFSARCLQALGMCGFMTDAKEDLHFLCRGCAQTRHTELLERYNLHTTAGEDTCSSNDCTDATTE
jgi:hypothetical protein